MNSNKQTEEQLLKIKHSKFNGGVLTIEERIQLSEVDKFRLSELYINRECWKKVVKDSTHQLKLLESRILTKEISLKKMLWSEDGMLNSNLNEVSS